MMNGQEGVFPYAGTSGWSGSDTSKQRAIDADSSGTTSMRQAEALEWLAYSVWRGMTWKDLSSALNVHHGVASGVLSVLHKTGRIARLKDTRDKCKVYVLPEYVNGRDVESHGSNALTFVLSYDKLRTGFPKFDENDWFILVDCLGKIVSEYMLDWKTEND